MILDVIVGLSLLLAIIQGYKKGFIIGIFSYLALVVSILLAMKFSNFFVDWIRDNYKVYANWLPLIVFMIIVIGSLFLIKKMALVIHKTVEYLMQGWLNRLLGILFFILIYWTFISVTLLFLSKMQWIDNKSLEYTYSYKIVQPIAPQLIEWISVHIIFFKNLLPNLSAYFQHN